MSALSNLDNIVLRETVNPPLSTKGSELTYAEWDAQKILLYNAIQSIISGDNVTAYDGSRTYDMFSTNIYDQFASYNGRIWKATYVGSPSSFSGQTPSEGIYWTQVSLAELLPDILKLAEQSSSSVAVLKEVSITISSADVLTLNSSPVTLVQAVSGKSIEVVSAIVKIDFNTTPYATNVSLGIGQLASEPQVELQCLDASVSTIRQLPTNAATGSTDTQLIVNSSLIVSTRTGDPTAGDSDIEIKVLYREVDMS